MKLALAISVFVLGISAAAASIAAASGTATSGHDSAPIAALTAPCPAATPQTVAQAVPAAPPVEVAAPATIKMPSTGSAGLLPGSRRIEAQSAPNCVSPTPATTPTTPTVTATAKAPTTPTVTPGPDANIPDLGGGPISGGGTGPGGYGY